MAENEMLDIRSSPRWAPVIRLIVRGAPAAEVEGCITTSLAKSWAAVQKQFRRSGFSLHEVLQASAEGDTQFLDKVYRDSKYHRFVRLIQNCKEFMDGPAEVLERTINSQLRIVRNQIRDLLIRNGHCATIAEADARVAGAFESIAPDAAAFARRLVDAPVRAGKLLLASHPSEAPAESIVHVSLINPALPVGVGR